MNFEHTWDFRTKLENAIEQMKLVLEKDKSVTLLGEQDHEYVDKYTVSEAVANSTTRSIKTALESLGLTKDLKINPSKNVILRFDYEESCKFNRKEKKSIPSLEVTHKVRGIFSSSTEIANVVEEFFWDLNVMVHIYLIYGGEQTPFSDVYSKHIQKFELNTKTDQAPRRDSTQTFQVDVTPITSLHPFTSTEFKINRTDAKCFTPRRNKDTEKYGDCVQKLKGWSQKCYSHIRNNVLQLSEADLTSYEDIKVLTTVAPVLDKIEEMRANNIIYVQAQESSLQTKTSAVSNHFKDTKFVPFGVLGLLLMHINDTSGCFLDSIHYIENLIHEQLVAAIGKELSCKDIAEYMAFHNRKLFKQGFTPKSFSVDVRRQGYTPEGNVAIECTDKTIITTISKLYKDPPPVKIALTASTQVMLEGSHHIHGFISYQFSTEPAPSYQISARARQFSSFILLIGTVVENDLFDAKHGIIIKNKDDLLIPLLFETIPTAKEFKDAIASLSPEQQRFAKAYRKMQLESTIFSVCLVQIKPQLENVLNLPPGSLTKEIKLTQALMQLFIEHQIPSDLLKYEGEGTKPLVDKIEYVKQAAKVLLDMIDEEKKKEMGELMEKAKLRESSLENIHYKSADLASVEYSRPMPMKKVKPSSMVMKESRGYDMPPPPPPVAVMSAAPLPVPKPVSLMAVAPSQPAQPVQSTQPTQNTQQQPIQETWEEVSATDYKGIPTKLDAIFEKYTSDSAIRSTIIKVGDYFSRTRKEGFHSAAVSTQLYSNEMKTEKSQALDLLDALTRSGELNLLDCEMHVVIGLTQCFDKSLMDTIVQDNCNPIEVIERSVLLMAKEILGHNLQELLNESEIARIKEVSSTIFE
ncbi:hypothetical protein HDV04_005323 [Boothiomyces sp. JEL0838]|nr:hypothetical protein HDV04_005323 [Boothiomyces sp. JEL0838]